MTEMTEQTMTRREKLIAATKEDGRQLVSIRKVDDLLPIPGADKIETAMIGGWPVVVKKGEFQIGQLGVFFEVDSFLNNEDPRFEFLATKRVKKIVDGVETEKVEDTSSEWNGIKGVRLKTIRLRKQLSQGLILPLRLFPEIATDENTDWNIHTSDGDVLISKYPDEQSEAYQVIRKLNFTETLGVIKWEKFERQSGGANLAGNTAGSFPSWGRKSDQPRCQGLNQEIFGYEQRIVPFDPTGIPPEAINEMLRAGKLTKTDEGLVRMYPPSANRNGKYEVTIKLDGSSMSAYGIWIKDENGVDVYKTGVCSRNLELKTDDGENDGNAFVETFRKKVKPILELNHGFGSIMMQFELMGPGIQGNQEKLEDYDCFLYNIFDIDQQEFMLPAQRKLVLNTLNSMAAEAGLDITIKHSPILYGEAALCELGITNMQELLKFAEGKSLNPDVDREGLVFKSLDRPFQFKAISNNWLEKNQG